MSKRRFVSPETVYGEIRDIKRRTGIFSQQLLSFISRSSGFPDEPALFFLLRTLDSHVFLLPSGESDGIV